MSIDSCSLQWVEIDELVDNIILHADKVWKYSEVSFEERRSSTLLADWIESEGFAIVDRNVAGIDTAWKAIYGSGSPVIGIMAEYDALPGLGNEAVPCKTPRKDGTTSGHGCGHNLIGAGAIGAAIALSKRMKKYNIPGTIEVFGCPGEETLAGKNFMAKSGAFNKLDACLHWHPWNINSTWNFHAVACGDLSIEWSGKTAHAGTQPWDGRSALHACELFAHGINTMREHTVPEARMHYFFENGGEAVNVVPDHTKITFRYRGPNAENLKTNLEWIRQIAEGSAMMTQTKVTITELTVCYDTLPNQVLSDRMHAYIETFGPPIFTEEEQAFAKSIQRESGFLEDGMSNVKSPDPRGGPLGGSTDVGDITYIVPTMGPLIAAWPQHMPPHHWGCTATHGMSIGHKAAVKAAQIIAATGLDLMTDKMLLDAATAEFKERTGGKPYECLCTADLPPAYENLRAHAECLHMLEAAPEPC